LYSYQLKFINFLYTTYAKQLVGSNCMEKTPEFLKNRILWRANHFKLAPDFTFLFEELPSSQQNAFSNLAETSGLGKPVIYFTKDINQWTLVCTNGIVSCYNDKSSKIYYTDIKSTTPEFFWILYQKENRLISAKQKSQNGTN